MSIEWPSLANGRKSLRTPARRENTTTATVLPLNGRIWGACKSDPATRLCREPCAALDHVDNTLVEDSDDISPKHPGPIQVMGRLDLETENRLFLGGFREFGR